MAVNVAKLASVATLDSTNFTAGLTKMRVSIGGFQGVALGAFASIGASLARMVSRGVSAMPRFISQGLALGDSLADSARMTGFAVEKLATYHRAAKLAGVGASEFDFAVNRLNVNIAKAIQGDKKFADILHRVGVDLSKISSLSPDETFLQLADAISKSTNALDRSFIAQKAFGVTGGRLIPLLSGGRARISALESSTRALGAAPSAMDVAKLEKANDAIADLGTVLTGLKIQLGKEFAEPLAKMATKLLKMVEERELVPETAKAISEALQPRTMKSYLPGQLGGLVPSYDKGKSLRELWTDWPDMLESSADNFPPPFSTRASYLRYQKEQDVSRRAREADLRRRELGRGGGSNRMTPFQRRSSRRLSAGLSHLPRPPQSVRDDRSFPFQELPPTGGSSVNRMVDGLGRSLAEVVRDEFQFRKEHGGMGRVPGMPFGATISGYFPPGVPKSADPEMVKREALLSEMRLIQLEGNLSNQQLLAQKEMVRLLGLIQQKKTGMDD